MLRVALAGMGDRRLDHVGVLVEGADRIAAALGRFGYEVGAPQEFPGEGTREIYVGAPDGIGRLLLLEAIDRGPYALALSSRGAGLHHVAIAATDVEHVVRGIRGSGWYLHPCSLASFRAKRAVWLARPGVRTLIEIFEAAAPAVDASAEPVVSRIELPVPADKPLLLQALGVLALVPSTDLRVWLTIGGRRFDPCALG